MPPLMLLVMLCPSLRRVSCQGDRSSGRRDGEPSLPLAGGGGGGRRTHGRNSLRLLVRRKQQQRVHAHTCTLTSSRGTFHCARWWQRA